MPVLRRYAWLVPALYGLLLLAAGIVWLVTGVPFDRGTYARLVGTDWSTFVGVQSPGTVHLLTMLFRLLGGNTAVLAGGVVLGVAVTAYRSRQLWAWMVIWLLPLHAALDLILLWRAGAFTSAALGWDSLLLVLTVTAQVVARPSRKPFP